MSEVKYEVRFTGNVAVPSIDKKLNVYGGNLDEEAIREAENTLVILYPVYTRAWVWKTDPAVDSQPICIADLSTKVVAVRRGV
jgi:hypothetical protein